MVSSCTHLSSNGQAGAIGVWTKLTSRKDSKKHFHQTKPESCLLLSSHRPRPMVLDGYLRKVSFTLLYCNNVPFVSSSAFSCRSEEHTSELQSRLGISSAV